MKNLLALLTILTLSLAACQAQPAETDPVEDDESLTTFRMTTQNAQ